MHVFSGTWSSPNVTGERPPPCSTFTFTSVGEKRAALFGGRSELAIGNLFIVELSRHLVVCGGKIHTHITDTHSYICIILYVFQCTK